MPMYRVALVAVLAGGVLRSPSASAEGAPIIVTLDDVIAAVPKAPGQPISTYEVLAAEAQVGAAGAWPGPVVRVETNRLTARLVTALSVPLPIFGTIGAARAEAAARADVVRAQAVVARRDLRSRAVLAWLAVARADGEIAALTIAAQQAAELERIARGRLEAGAGAEVDVSAAHAARTRADLAVANANRTQQAATAGLAAVLGWDPLRSIVTGGTLPIGDASLETLRAHLVAHPERVVAARQITLAGAGIDRVRKLRFPGLAIDAQVAFDDPTTPGTDALVAVSLELPLFSRIGDQLRAARATTAAEQARLASTEAQLGGALVASYRRWQAAGERLVALERDVLPAQIRATTLSQQAYREGARDLSTALQADRDLAAVRGEVTTARADVAMAWIELQTAAGEEPGAPHAP